MIARRKEADVDVKILIQRTPNPYARKFIVNHDVKTDGKITFNDANECRHVPLALALISLPSVSQVHFFENVITVTQNGQNDWELLEGMVKEVIVSLFPQHNPAFVSAEEVRRQTLSPELKQIEEILDNSIRPFLQGDGGDLEVLSLRDNQLTIRYEGACGTCPSSAGATLEAIESILRDEFDPEITVVPM